MVNQKFSREQLGEFKAILDLNYSLSQTQLHFRRQSIYVSIGYLSKIRSGKKDTIPSPNKKRPGRKSILTPRQVRGLLNRIDCEDPPTQKQLGLEYKVDKSTISRIIKKQPMDLQKTKFHAMTASTIDKRHRRSWNLYRMLRKEKWKNVITCDESWVYLTNCGGKRSIRYLKFGQKRKDAEVLPQIEHTKGIMVWVAFSADGFFKPIFIKLGAK